MPVQDPGAALTERTYTRPMPTPAIFLLMTTCPDAASAATLARGLVEHRLAACVSQLPGLVSTYRWQGELCQENEIQLLIKTPADRLEAARDWLVAHHPYDVPELLALPVADGLPAYLHWVVAQTREET